VAEGRCAAGAARADRRKSRAIIRSCAPVTRSRASGRRAARVRIRNVLYAIRSGGTHMNTTNVRVTILSCSIVLAGMVLAACGARGDKVAAASDDSGSCSREKLMKLTDAYVQAQTAGQASQVPLDNGAYYGENDQAMD